MRNKEIVEKTSKKDIFHFLRDVDRDVHRFIFTPTRDWRDQFTRVAVQTSLNLNGTFERKKERRKMKKKKINENLKLKNTLKKKKRNKEISQNIFR